MSPKETLVKKRSDFFNSSKKQPVIQQNQYNKFKSSQQSSLKDPKKDSSLNGNKALPKSQLRKPIFVNKYSPYKSEDENTRQTTPLIMTTGLHFHYLDK